MQVHFIWIIVALLIKYIFDALVGAMEAPDASSSRRYRYWFRALNLFSANVDRSKLWDSIGGPK